MARAWQAQGSSLNTSLEGEMGFLGSRGLRTSPVSTSTALLPRVGVWRREQGDVSGWTAGSPTRHPCGVPANRFRHHRGAAWVLGGREDKRGGHPGQLTHSQSWSRDRHFGGSMRASWSLVTNQPSSWVCFLSTGVLRLTEDPPVGRLLDPLIKMFWGSLS